MGGQARHSMVSVVRFCRVGCGHFRIVEMLSARAAVQSRIQRRWRPTFSLQRVAHVGRGPLRLLGVDLCAWGRGGAREGEFECFVLEPGW